MLCKRCTKKEKKISLEEIGKLQWDMAFEQRLEGYPTRYTGEEIQKLEMLWRLSLFYNDFMARNVKDNLLVDDREEVKWMVSIRQHNGRM